MRSILDFRMLIADLKSKKEQACIAVVVVAWMYIIIPALVRIAEELVR